MNVFREALRRRSAFVVRKGRALPKQNDVGGCFTLMGTGPAKQVLTSYAGRFLPPRKIGPKAPKSGDPGSRTPQGPRSAGFQNTARVRRKILKCKKTEPGWPERPARLLQSRFLLNIRPLPAANRFVFRWRWKLHGERKCRFVAKQAKLHGLVWLLLRHLGA